MGLILAYARERLLSGSVLGAVLLVTTGAQLGRGFPSIAIGATDIPISLCLVISFRIWDDLMDRARDRMLHSDRIAVRATSVRSLSLAASCLALAGASAVLRAHGAMSLSLLVAFSCVLATWYAVRGTRSAAGDRLLLSKYAVFTFALIGPSLTPRAAASALGVYLAACVYEWRHDRESPVFSFGGSR